MSDNYTENKMSPEYKEELRKRGESLRGFLASGAMEELQAQVQEEKVAMCSEGYPKDWVEVRLMVSPHGECHAIGGDHKGEPGTDGSYPGLDRINQRLEKAEAEVARLTADQCKHQNCKEVAAALAEIHRVVVLHARRAGLTDDDFRVPTEQIVGKLATFLGNEKAEVARLTKEKADLIQQIIDDAEKLLAQDLQLAAAREALEHLAAGNDASLHDVGAMRAFARAALKEAGR